MQHPSNPKKKTHGFTLVELLVIISIIVLLLIIVLFVLGIGHNRASRVTKCLGNLKNIQVGTENYSLTNNGVIPTGVPPRPRPRPAIDTTHQPVFSINWNRAFEWPSDQSFHYGEMNRYWYTGLAKAIAQDVFAEAIWDEVFLCPDDNLYSEKAYQLRTSGDKNKIPRISYLMTDTAFWSPDMFTAERINQILEKDQLYTDGVNHLATNGPATPQTRGRLYLPTSQVKFPAQKVYIYEVNAFHDNPKLGYNTRGLKATALFFDGHAENVQASSTEYLPNNLYLKISSRMAWTDEAPDKNDPLWWYYSTTRNGIFGRDFIK